MWTSGESWKKQETKKGCAMFEILSAVQKKMKRTTQFVSLCKVKDGGKKARNCRESDGARWKEGLWR